jgi:hypothetical protein
MVLTGCSTAPRLAPPPAAAAPATAGDPTVTAGDSTLVPVAGDTVLMRVLAPLSVTPLPDEPPARGDAWPDVPSWTALPPSSTRTASGAPGAEYWQQRADYTITATLDTGLHTVRGHVTVRYANHSPDTLRALWLQLDQNLYAEGSRGAAAFPDEVRWGRGSGEPAGGMTLGDLRVNGRAAAHVVRDTRLRVALAEPLVPRTGTATLDVDFAFRVPRHGSDRMGRDGALYFIAQWFPRMAVYDDVGGWHTDPYLGQGEFYLEYGDIDLALTVPAGYVVAATGTLENAEAVLTPTQRARLARAPGDSGAVAVITEAEARAARTTPVAGMRTWRFRARDVRDAAWAAAPDFRWDAGRLGATWLHALWQPGRAGRSWAHAVDYTRWTLAAVGALLDAPYPYPQATSVAAPLGGMEYPMLVFNGFEGDAPTSVFEVNDHEHGHAWFPMLVGSDERRFAWMDEGLNSYVNLFTLERFFPGRDVFGEYAGAWLATAGTAGDVPLMTPADRIPASSYGTIAYFKPAAVLTMLRNVVVGAEAFDAALREYVRRWRGRHPTPWDFFRTVDDVTGESLDWFWRAFFFGTAVPEVGIASVSMVEPVGRPATARVEVTGDAAVPLPLSLRLTTVSATTGGDTTAVDWSVPSEAWRSASGGRLSVSVPVPAGRTVVGARLWPDGLMIDADASNDTWGAALPVMRPDRVSGGGLTSGIPRPPRPGGAGE